ncbi:MAG: DUF6600 domain-containing protein [Candidatus Tumulicola sp.]
MRTKRAAGLLGCLLVWATLGPAVDARAAALDSKTGDAGTAAVHVARVSIIQTGAFFITPRDAATPVAARVNAPLMPGDAFESDDAGARAEIQLDGLSELRFDGRAAGRIDGNGAGGRRIEVTGGSFELSILRGGDTVTEISTPTIALRTRYAGAYRISMGDDGSATVTPRSGQCDVVMPHKTVTVLPGATLVVHGAADSASSHSATARDAFDEFSASRDSTLLAALTDDVALPASIAGYDDFDAVGRWASLPAYGRVWVPQQSSAWAPYRHGAWSYQNPYGWTWIGAEPWAWVPYHYGRWLYSSGYGWCWYPPPAGFDPIWAPALVGFFGLGTGPLGFSQFGWVPLAPFEPYVAWNPQRYYPPPAPPPRRHRNDSPRMHPLTAAFRNARFGGATVIDVTAWSDGNFAHATAADAGRVGGAPVVSGAPPVTHGAIAEKTAPIAVPRSPSSTNALPTLRASPANALSTIPVTRPANPAPRGTTIVPARTPPSANGPTPAHTVHSSSAHPPA